MKARVIDKEVNAAWMLYNSSGFSVGGTNKSTDKVWLLTATEIGGKTVAPTLDDMFGSGAISALNSSGNDGEEYDYFLDDVNNRISTGNSGKVAGSYSRIWLATGMWNTNSYRAKAFYVNTSGPLSETNVDVSSGVVPAIRVA